MPYSGEHSARIRQPAAFDPKTFRRTKGGKAVLPGSGLITVPESISIIWGKLKSANKPSDNPLVQALRFPVSSWTAGKAKKWLTDNKVKFISFEKAAKAKDMMDIESKSEGKRNLVLAVPIFEYTAERFIEKVDEIPDDEDLNIWLNSPGGSVFAGWSIIGRLKLRSGQCNITVLGHAASMAFLFTAYGDEVEALDVTKFMVHRASGYVRNDDDKKLLDEINADLLAKLKKRINNKKLKELTGTTLDKLWKSDERKDLWLSAKDAKEIGLVDKIIRLEPEKMTALTNQFVAFYDFGTDPYGNGEVVEVIDDSDSQGSDELSSELPGSSETVTDETYNSQTKKKMTKQELQAQHPELYNEIYGEGKTAGITEGQTTERNRVQTWMAFLDVDKENILKAVKDGEDFTTAKQAELVVKMTAKKETTNTADDSADDITTDPVKNKAKEQKDLEKFEKDVDEGIDVKNIVS